MRFSSFLSLAAAVLLSSRGPSKEAWKAQCCIIKVPRRVCEVVLAPLFGCRALLKAPGVRKPHSGPAQAAGAEKPGLAPGRAGNSPEGRARLMFARTRHIGNNRQDLWHCSPQ